MKLNQQKYEEALKRESLRQHLNLGPVAFRSGAVKRNESFAPDKRNGNTDTEDDTGSAEWEEQEHRRGADGRFIEKGSSGVEVRAAAAAMGMRRLPNEFDESFEDQVRDYQEDNGLLVDGIIGRQTAAALIDNEDADSTRPGEITEKQIKRLVRQMRTPNSKRRESAEEESDEE